MQLGKDNSVNVYIQRSDVLIVSLCARHISLGIDISFCAPHGFCARYISLGIDISFCAPHGSLGVDILLCVSRGSLGVDISA